MADIPYHSAHWDPIGAKPSTGCQTPTGVIFAHDIMTSTELPYQYADVDALYVEIPWSRGFSVFNKRAAVKDKRTYPQFLERVDRLARWAERPTLIVGSAAACKQLSGRTYPISLTRPGVPAVASAVTSYWDKAPLERTTEKLIARLTREWSTVGDFCCGYGTTVRAAIRGGSNYVASDYNTEAIGCVCANAPRWQ